MRKQEPVVHTHDITRLNDPELTEGERTHTKVWYEGNLYRWEELPKEALEIEEKKETQPISEVSLLGGGAL